MKLHYKALRFIALISLLLIFSVLLAACSSDNSTPDSPSGLDISDGNESVSGMESEESDSDFNVTEDSEGRQILTFSIPDLSTENAYFAIVESEDGQQITIPLSQSEDEDDQLEGPSPVVYLDQEYTIQIFFYEAYAPVFGEDVGFSGIVKNSFIYPQGMVLPEAFQPPENLGVIDFSILLKNLCTEWVNNDKKTDDLDFICNLWPPNFLSEDFFGGNMNCFSNPFDPLCGYTGDETAATMPDPDCAGEDAGSFWCQETEEEPYYAGRMAVLCKSQLGINFEDPLIAVSNADGALEMIDSSGIGERNMFEDPLTAFTTGYFSDEEEEPIIQFEDPLTAFEDPLTAFEDPLTAFEDPLTAFEDPLTALDVARITILYTAMHQFMEDTSQFPACNTLALLGSAGHYERTGETLLSAISQWYSTAQPISQKYPFNNPTALDTSDHCSEYFKTQIQGDWFNVNTGIPKVDLSFNFTAGIPGMTYSNQGDPIPYIYTAELGGIESENCSLPSQNWGIMGCTIDPYDQSNFGQEQDLVVYVTGCSEPIYESSIVLPEYDYNRCDIFEDMEFNLYVSQASTDLQLYVTRSGGVPGPTGWGFEDYPGFDDMMYYFNAAFDDIYTYEVFPSVSEPEKLYATFEVPYNYLTSQREFSLYINKCDEYIFTKWITIIEPTAVPDVTEVPTDEPSAEPTAMPAPAETPTSVPCFGYVFGSCDVFDWDECKCTVCAAGYVDPDLDGVCTELN